MSNIESDNSQNVGLEDYYNISVEILPSFTTPTTIKITQGLLNRWTLQLDLGCTTGGLERVVSVHNST